MTSSIFATEHPLTTDKDISSEEFWRAPFAVRDETFRWLRDHAPVSWHAPLEDTELPPEVHGQAGFWAVVLAEDIQYVSQHPALFSSELGSVQVRPRHPDLYQPPTFLELDPPRHTAYRRIMSAGFTPKAVRRINDKIDERAVQIVDAVAGGGDFDFVDQVAAKLPMLTVADMVGVPESLVHSFAEAGDAFVGGRDPALLPEGMSPLDFTLQAMTTLKDIGMEIVEHRRTHPADDIATALAQAEIDGKPLDEGQIASVMLLLSVAGNDTTKQTTSWTVYSLDRNPDQKAWLVEDLDARLGPSIDEFIRHASPVIDFARTATEDTELRGMRIAAGDKVALFYCSGNRDERHFPDPHRFDLQRATTGHVGFGGGGPHFCLGNTVARVQLRALFREILTRIPTLEVTAEPSLLYSEFIHGIRRLPVRV